MTFPKRLDRQLIGALRRAYAEVNASATKLRQRTRPSLQRTKTVIQHAYANLGVLAKKLRRGTRPARRHAPADARVSARQLGHLIKLSLVDGLTRAPKVARKHKLRLTIVGLVLASVAAIIAWLVPGNAYAEVNGRAVSLVGKRETIAQAIRAAGIRTGPGVMYSAVSHHVIIGHAVPPLILLNGRHARRSATVTDGDRIEVRTGAATEPVVSRMVAQPNPGLPNVETKLWDVGQPRVVSQTIGLYSWEVVSQEVLQPGTAPSPYKGKAVALTFDDGPDPRYTPNVLQILNQEGIHATFCLIGYEAAKFPDLVKAEAQQGETLCDHTWDHNERLDRAPLQLVTYEIDRGAETIASIAGVEPQFYRPPGGTLSPTIVSVAHARGLRVLYWTIDSEDYRVPPTSVLLSRVLAAVPPGAIILFHDGGGDRSHTVAALTPLIDALKAQGYSFVTPALEPSPTVPLPVQPSTPSLPGVPRRTE